MSARRYGSLAAAVALVLTLTPLAPGPAAAQAVTEACPAGEVTPPDFGDVAPGSTHAAAIACMAWWEIAQGRTAGAYDPSTAVNRGQLASFLMRLIRSAGGSLPAAPPDRFDDDGGIVHHFAINRLAAVGVVQGQTDTMFAPGAAVSRGQLASLLVRAYEHRSGTALPDGDDAFDDDDGSVHETSIDKAAAAGLTLGVAEGAFDPSGLVSRAQVATFLARTLELLVDDGVVTDTPTTLRLASDLDPFGACDELLGHLKERALPLVGPTGLAGDALAGPIPAMGGGRDDDGGEGGGPDGAPTTTVPGSSGPQAGVDHSGTNNQEDGVDEGDVVKTDGQRLFSVLDGDLQAVDLTGGTPRVAGALDVPGYASQLLLHEGRALVLSTDMLGPGGVGGGVGAADEPTESGWRSAATLTLVDVTDVDDLRPLSTLRVDGYGLATRLVEGVARVVLRSDPTLPFVSPTVWDEADVQATTATNLEVVATSTAEDWLPHWSSTDETTGATDEGLLLGCDDVRHPPEFSGLGVLSVLTVDMGGTLSPDGATGVLAGGEVVYGSPSTLYVATTKWGAWQSGAESLSETTTEVHAFDIGDPATATYEASGEVTGNLLNQFSLSEHEGVLRVATTTLPPWWSGDPTLVSESRVTTLQQDGGSLVEVGHVAGLGQGERIYAVRFIGDVGYVVTFRQVDPLYTIDLADPAAPRVAGELKLTGYSAYLHPAGEGLLLGVGVEASEEGMRLGTQVSLFDVADPADPTLLHRTSIDNAYSEVEYDHHAFLFWPPTGLAMLPLQQWSFDEATGATSSFDGAVGYDVDPATGIHEVGRVTHTTTDDDWAASIRRSMVVGDAVYTLSLRGIGANDLDDLDDRSFTPFPG